MQNNNVMEFGDLKTGDYFRFPKGSYFAQPGVIYIKNGLNSSSRIQRTGVDGCVWGYKKPIVKLDPKKVSIRMKRDCFVTLEGLDCYEGDGMVVFTGEAFATDVLGLRSIPEEVVNEPQRI